MGKAGWKTRYKQQNGTTTHQIELIYLIRKLNPFTERKLFAISIQSTVMDMARNTQMKNKWKCDKILLFISLTMGNWKTHIIKMIKEIDADDDNDTIFIFK